jgi:hypothetical protein
MAVSTVWRCVQLLSRRSARCPGRSTSSSGRMPTRARSTIIRSPRSSSIRRISTWIACSSARPRRRTCLRGNTYSLKETRGDGNVSSLYPIPAKQVTPSAIAIRRDRIRYIVRTAASARSIRGEDLACPGCSDSTAWSASRRSATAGTRSRSRPRPRNSARAFSERRARLGVVKIPQWLEDDQRAKAKKNIEEFSLRPR